MKYTLAQISQHIDGEIVGNAELEISSVSGIKEAGAGQICFLANPHYIRELKSCNASAIIMLPDIDVPEGKSAIIHPNPSLAFI